MSSDDEGDVRSRVNSRKHVSDLSDLSDNDDNDNKKPASNVEDDIFGDDGGDDGGHDDGEDHDGKQLFGESDEEAENEPHTKHEGRTLDDEQLDSGDDEGRYDRQGDYMMDDEGEAEQGRINVMDLDLARAPDLESTDGEVYTLNVPNFLSIETEDFNPETYVPPPFNAASTSICWRYDPENEEKVQSNARIIKWEDGSMTLQLASSPKDQYRITSKRLARSHNAPTTNDYNSQLDSHVYLGVPSESANVIRISSHLTSQLNVLPTNMEMDDAVERLRDSLAAAQSKGRELPTFEVKEDPELAKKQAEMAEREKLRADRKRMAQQERELDRGRRVGLYNRSGGGGLTVAGLEDEDGGGMSTTRARKPRRQRGEIYTDDEGQDRRGRTREDEYDEDDGFLVGSDEEPETYSDEEEEEEMEGGEGSEEEEEAEERRRPRKDKDRARRSSKQQRPQQQQQQRARSTTPKRSRDEEAGDRKPSARESPEAEDADEVPYVRKKKRYTIGDDDEDE